MSKVCVAESTVIATFPSTEITFTFFRASDIFTLSLLGLGYRLMATLLLFITEETGAVKVKEFLITWSPLLLLFEFDTTPEA